MQFYCTAGRGTEKFVREEIRQQFGQDVEVGLHVYCYCYPEKSLTNAKKKH
jgi:hypothetical protein